MNFSLWSLFHQRGKPSPAKIPTRDGNPGLPTPKRAPRKSKKNKKSHLLTFILLIYLLTGFIIGILSFTKNITYH